MGSRALVDELAKRKTPVPCQRWKAGHPDSGLDTLLPRLSGLSLPLFQKRCKNTNIIMSVRYNVLQRNASLDY